MKSYFISLNTKIIQKPYEPMWFQTFYFATPIFVERLHVMRKLPDFSHNFLKCFSDSIKYLNTGFKKEIKENKNIIPRVRICFRR